MDFENSVKILNDHIKIKLTRTNYKSLIFFVGSFFLFILGLFLIALNNISNKHEILTWILIWSAIENSVLDMMLYLGLTLFLFFIYNTIVWFLLEYTFTIFPYDLYKVLSYALGFLVTFAYPIHRSILITGISVIFSAFVILTDGFSYKMYIVTVLINKKTIRIEYWAKTAKFLFVPYVNAFTLSNSNLEYYYFIRLKGRSIIDKKFIQHYDESGNIYWNLDEEAFYEEIKFSKSNSYRFECFLYFENASKNGVEVNHVYVLIGSFIAKNELVDFLNLLSAHTNLKYKGPPQVSTKIRIF